MNMFFISLSSSLILFLGKDGKPLFIRVSMNSKLVPSCLVYLCVFHRESDKAYEVKSAHEKMPGAWGINDISG